MRHPRPRDPLPSCGLSLAGDLASVKLSSPLLGLVQKLDDLGRLALVAFLLAANLPAGAESPGRGHQAGEVPNFSAAEWAVRAEAYLYSLLDGFGSRCGIAG